MFSSVLYLLSLLHGVRPIGDDSWIACCPAHEDRRPSLSIGEGDDGRALIYCHTGCSTEAVCAAIGLTLADLMPVAEPGRSRRSRGSASTKPAQSSAKPGIGKRRRPAKTFATAAEVVADLDRWKGRHSAWWYYQDAEGEPIGLAVRFDGADGGKEVLPIRRNADGRWQLGAMTEPRPLYHLPELLTDSESTVYVAEGEKCADAARSIGLLATTSAGGCMAAVKTDWSPLAGRSVVVLPDNDDPGTVYAESVVAALGALAHPATVRIAHLPGLREGGDVVDWLAANGGADHE